jgi:hypothetical protein
MNVQRVIVGLITALATAASVIWFLNTFELKETEEYIGFKGEAKTNTLYAARLFLKRMGIPAERRDSLTTLPDTDSVLIIDTGRYTLSTQKIDQILAWVERGGHLITRARIPGDTTTLYGTDKNDDEADAKASARANKADPLQTALGVRIGKHVMPEDDDLPLDVTLSGMSHSLEADPGFFYSLETDADDTYPQHYKKATWLLEQKWGKGMVTLAANLDFIENGTLVDYQHAELLWNMVHGVQEQPHSVWLVHQDDMPPLWTLLWKHAWALMLTLAVLILLTFLALMPRFGPLLPNPQPERRRILEHIRASGRFMWKRYKLGDGKQYSDFATATEQLYPSTRKHHDKQQPDA